MQGRTRIPSPAFCSWFIPLTTAIQPFLVCIIVASNSWAPHLWLFIRGLTPTKGPRWTHSWDRKIWRLSYSHLVGLGIRFTQHLISMCFPEELSDHSWKPKSPFWQVLTKEPCRVLVSLMMITVCLYSIEDFSLHSPPQSSPPLYGNPWVSCSLNHDWDCQGFWHCPGRLSLPSEHTLHSAGPAGRGHRCSISNEHVARHRVELQQTFIKWMKEKLLHLLSHLRGQASSQAPSPPPSPFTPCH